MSSPLSFFEAVLFDQPAGIFTYSYHTAVCVGTVVQVPFGKKNRYAVIIRVLDAQPQVSYTIKNCIAILLEQWFCQKEINFLMFSARYYHTDLCDVLKSSFSRIVLDRIVKQREHHTKDAVSHETEKTEDFSRKLSLNNDQKKVVSSVVLGTFSRHLIYGVTGSGKTRTYLDIASEALKTGNVLYLVPEIYLTTTLLEVIEQTLGVRVMVYHSLISPKKREECLRYARYSSKGMIFLGARSAVFLPIRALSLVIIDEEHDSSYKNQEGRFRYHARDLAIYKAQLFSCPCILGSATPSPRWFIDKNGQIHTLLERATGYSNPPIELKSVNMPTFELPLDWSVLKEIQVVLEREEQVLIFLNQKGYAPRLYCQECRESTLCESCHAPMTVHEEILMCHHCGVQEPLVSNQCPQCQNNRVLLGFGLDRLEEFLKEVFPAETVIKIDKQTAGTVKAFEKQLDLIRQNHRAIIIGTQMISKGYDWPKVTLCVILVAPFQIRYFLNPGLLQQIFQTAGRSGRHAVGSVICPVSHQDFGDEKDLHEILQSENYENYCKHYIEENGKDMRFFAKISYRSMKLTECLKTIRQLITKLPPKTVFGPMLDYPAKKNRSWNIIWYLHTASRSEREQLLHYLEVTLHPAYPFLEKAFLSIEIDPIMNL